MSTTLQFVKYTPTFLSSSTHTNPPPSASSHVDYKRFLHHISASGKISQKEEELKKAFAKLDKDQSGYIEWNELSYILSDITGEALQRPLSSDEVDNIMEISDTSHDGRLDYNGGAPAVK
uniref:Parvalbumin n=1 Tax=Eptatretus burgeri TaxID=7764 RepID=A0A8C4NAU2_EPTBU